MNAKGYVVLAGILATVGACNRQPGSGTTTTTAAPNPVPAGSRIRGVLQKVDANTLAVRAYDGRSVNVPVDAQTAFAWVVKSDLTTLKTGDFIGTATTGPDNALRAVELVIFPASMRGSGEGHYGWDVPGVVAAKGGSGSGSSAMTNGTVEQQSAMTNGTVQQQSAMTNGTVTSGTGQAGGTKLTISYKGGKSEVIVPAGTPIVRFEPTQRLVLAAGEKLFAVTPLGASAAKFVAIGKDGLTPPM